MNIYCDENISQLILHLNNIYFTEKYQRIKNKYNLSFYQLSLKLFGNKFKDYKNYASEIIKNHNKKNINIITYTNELYPDNLRYIQTPPFVLFAKGNLNLLKNESKISIVGTRRPSPISCFYSKFISNFLSKHNYTIVSGMASGIDSISHRGAIIEKGGTIGIIAHGLDHVYPQKNHDLFNLALNNNINDEKKNILLLSEYPLGVKPKNYHFPKRNRIITGLSKILFFIEGGIKSGALISVKYALNQGRDVYVLRHPFMKNNEGGENTHQEGALDLSNYFRSDIISDFEFKNNFSNTANNTFYMGNGLWCKFYEPSFSAPFFLE
ncbi:MAG: DNA-processing protein DprA [Spirochaetia bacterium]|nr:DNA-processing protein DprA [Spirochaetia bacterium]